MKQVVKINLDNEMDLILAHRRSMKIAELCGLPLASQTRFSTAVSEIARCSISNGKSSFLTLGIEVVKATQKNIIAVISDTVDLKACNPAAYQYAGKISGNVEYDFNDGFYQTILSHAIASPGLISETKIAAFKDFFKFEPPISPYDEIRKKNVELIALSEKLSESENKYRDLTNTLPLLICTVDERNKISLFNTWLGKYLDVPIHTFDKTSLTTILHPEDVNKVAAEWEKCKKECSSYQGQVRLKHNGTFIWHLISIIPNKIDTQHFNYIIFFVDIDAEKLVETTLRDNSELKKTQMELQQLNLSLSAKNRELEQFAFVASHDLQEPLRKIMTMISRAAEKMPADQQKEIYLDRIHLSASRMSNLITDVLNFSRMDNQHKSAGKVNLNKIISTTLEDIETIVEEKHARISIENLPTVIGIASQLQQLFFNLLTNALKFNRDIPIINVAIGHSQDTLPEALADRELGYHLIQVSDNGIGMDQQYSGKIFNMFQRLHHRDIYGGNGIGLALCRRIAENHGGTITFESNVDIGTTFNVYLPVTL